MISKCFPMWLPNTLILKDSFTSFNNSVDFADTKELMSKMTGVIDKLNRTKNNREFILLSAVRPYMRSSRRGTIDTCLKLLQVVNVVNEMKKES